MVMRFVFGCADLFRTRAVEGELVRRREPRRRRRLHTDLPPGDRHRDRHEPGRRHDPRLPRAPEHYHRTAGFPRAARRHAAARLRHVGGDSRSSAHVALDGRFARRRRDGRGTGDGVVRRRLVGNGRRVDGRARSPYPRGFRPCDRVNGSRRAPGTDDGDAAGPRGRQHRRPPSSSKRSCRTAPAPVHRQRDLLHWVRAAEAWVHCPGAGGPSPGRSTCPGIVGSPLSPRAPSRRPRSRPGHRVRAPSRSGHHRR